MNCNIRGYILQYFLNEVYYQFEKNLISEMIHFSEISMILNKY